MTATTAQDAADAARGTPGASEPAQRHVRTPDGERNAWAGTPARERCNLPLVFPCSRDPLDGGNLRAFLDRLSEQRSEGAVVEEVTRWLASASSASLGVQPQEGVA